jgi:hypothetical protein
MPARNRHDRDQIAKIAASTRWGHERDRVTATAPARAGLRDKFEREANPDGSLPPDEVARRADHLQRAHMLRMSRAAAAARSRRARAGTSASKDATPEDQIRTVADCASDVTAQQQDRLAVLPRSGDSA